LPTFRIKSGTSMQSGKWVQTLRAGKYLIAVVRRKSLT